MVHLLVQLLIKRITCLVRQDPGCSLLNGSTGSGTTKLMQPSFPFRSSSTKVAIRLSSSTGPMLLPIMLEQRVGASIGLAGATSGKFLSISGFTTPTASSVTETSNIAVKPAAVQTFTFTGNPQTYTSSAVSQTGGFITPGTVNQVVATLQVVMGGGSGAGLANNNSSSQHYWL